MLRQVGSTVCGVRPVPDSHVNGGLRRNSRPIRDFQANEQYVRFGGRAADYRRYAATEATICCNKGSAPIAVFPDTMSSARNRSFVKLVAGGGWTTF